MGQYYKGVIIRDNEKQVYETIINGEWEGCKLMEHSRFNNDYVNAIMFMLKNAPAKVAWVGDYADNAENYWNEPAIETLTAKDFNSLVLYLVNHSKKEYIVLNMYYIDNARASNSYWVIHPLPLLTAVGNGRGGGDYRGINQELVGSWAFDTIELMEWDKWKSIKNDYNELRVIFKEG